MKKILAASILALASVPALAYTECTITPTWLFIWPDTTLVIGAGSLVVSVPASAAANKQYTALAELAFISGRTLNVRYTADGVNCATATNRSDIAGLQLNQ